MALVASLGSSPSAPARAAQDDELVVDAAELEPLIDPIFERVMRQEQIPGAAFAMVQCGEIVLSKGYGVADLESGRAVDPAATVFRIGSVSKAVTGVALSRLVDEKKLGLDEDLNPRLEGLGVETRHFGPLRVSHLMTHTAGFDQRGLNRSFFDLADGRTQPWLRYGTLVDRSRRPPLREFLRRELVRIRPPGQVACYDTYGVCFAGLLVEEISGQPYPEAMQRLVFRPLGMTHTWIEIPDERHGELATGYALQEGKKVPLPYEYYATLPASSVDSTVVDVAQLLIALLGGGSNDHGRVLSEAGARATLARQFFPREAFPGFSHLFFEEFRRGRRLVEHGGTMLGFSSKLVLLPEAGVGFFGACNRDSETGPAVGLHETLTRALMERWFGAEEPPARPAKALEIDVARFAGPYAGTIYGHTCDEGEGWTRSVHPVRAVGPGTIEISGRRFFAVEPLLFVREDGRVRVLFRENGRGEITHRFDGDNAASTYEKLGEWLLDEALGAGWRERPATPLAAMTWRALERWDEAAAAYEQLAAARPKDGRVRHYGGLCALRGGHPERARPLLEGAFELGTRPPETAILLAAAHAQSNDADRALEWLRRALDLGASRSAIDAEPALGKLRDDPRFQEVVRGRPQR